MSALHLGHSQGLTVQGNINTQVYNAQPGNINSVNNIVASNNLVAGNAVQAKNYYSSDGSGYVITAGYVSAGTNLIAGGYVQAGAYVQASIFKTTNATYVAGVSNSAAIGAGATACSYSSLVVGQNNVGKALDGSTAPSVNSWRDGTSGQPIDPLLEVGIGANSSNKNNAFTVYKDGTVRVGKAQGDILMGEFAP